MKPPVRLSLIVFLGMLAFAGAAEDLTAVRQLWFRPSPFRKPVLPLGSALDEGGNPFLVYHFGGSPTQHLVKLSASRGQTLWERPLGFKRVVPSSFAVARNGDVFTVSKGDSGEAGTIVRLSPEGEVIWSKTFPASAGGIALDANANVIVTGSSTIKYSGINGAMLWKRSNLPEIFFTRILVDHAGDVILASTHLAVKVAKYSGATGTTVWERSYGSLPIFRSATAELGVDPAGNVAILASIHGGDFAPEARNYLTRYSASGSIIWEQENSNAYGPIGTALGVDSMGNVFVNDISFHLSKFSAQNGALQWRTDIGRNPTRLPPKLVVDANDDVITAIGGGVSERSPPSYVARFDGANGSVVWKRRFSSVAGIARYFATGPGVVFATGYLFGSLHIPTVSAKYATGPSPRTLDAEILDETSVRFHAEATPNGFDTEVSFIYGAAPDLRAGTSTPSVSIGKGRVPREVRSTVSFLQPGTTFYYRAVGIAKDGETTLGEVRSVKPGTTP